MLPTIKQSLMALFSAFPAPDSFDPEQSTMAYLMAIEDLPPEHIASAVKRFIRAEVSRPAHRFLPTAAELAQEARRIRDEAGYRSYLAIPRPQPEPQGGKSPEERAEVAKLMADLAMDMARKQAACKRDPRFSAPYHLTASDELSLASDFYAGQEIKLSPAALARVGIETKEANA